MGRSRHTDRRSDPPAVFSERTHRVARLAVPVVLGLVYGVWAATNRRFGGPVTGWNLLFGLLTALAFIVLWLAVQHTAPKLRGEGHAALWAAFTGCAIGFLVIQSNYDVLWSSVLGLFSAAGVFLTLFYWFHTRGDTASQLSEEEADHRAEHPAGPPARGSAPPGPPPTARLTKS